MYNKNKCQNFRKSALPALTKGDGVFLSDDAWTVTVRRNPSSTDQVKEDFFFYN